MRPFPPQSIHIEGRRWFQRGPGNTYHTVRIWIDGEHMHTSGRTYGYGEGFLQTAFEWMGAHVWPHLAERHANGSPKHYGTQYLREVMYGTYSVSDVGRERDL